MHFAALALPPAIAVVANEFSPIVDRATTAGWVSRPPAHPLAHYASLCGMWLPGHPNYTAPALPEYEYDTDATYDDAIDWRTRAANCTTISLVRDQGACGSCWAFSATEAFGDRRCVATGKDIELSAQDTAGCCTGFSCGASHGCEGGQPTHALSWLATNGVVTGGDFATIASGASCKPYQLPPCAHHSKSKYPACGAELSIHCTTACSEESYPTAYESDKVTGGSATVLSTESAMIAALHKGPISAGFTVYDDFPTYISGVYKHVSNVQLGGHAVEIVGYGTQDGDKYWLVKNSWNSAWGDAGFFKILRGSNECGIEEHAAAIDF